MSFRVNLEPGKRYRIDSFLDGRTADVGYKFIEAPAAPAGR
jgi:hypothetical protein